MCMHCTQHLDRRAARHELTADSFAVLRSIVLGPNNKIQVGKCKFSRSFPSPEDIRPLLEGTPLARDKW